MKALETGNLNYVLVWIREESENELRGIFEKTLRGENRRRGNSGSCRRLVL